ncbi:TetR family transcriptional regulator [Leptothoe sp. PORK10 BA2]|uniref:TetR family transcriptional regulator n=1 Tax=Leptothoe sp. PORK10 BA2 TaxID=3110254 RepID=UPI002B1FECF3|nr:TetR family transcriptional regulator [Leptothoe sp. PORK10 BA2]MEA5464180.1 TetR family transcriptional regulator [Leptothoe sp. PORK10 BA2]
MSTTRQRLTEAALELFLSQGISHTTTRQIANMAEVNEATLFRNFGNKYGLLLATLQETPAFIPATAPLYGESVPESLRAYASDYLSLLEQHPNFVRSLIGEADQYPPEHLQALHLRLSEIRQTMAQYLERLLGHSFLSGAQGANVLAALLVGYVVLETTTGESLWESRDSFLDVLVRVLTTSEATPPGELAGEPAGAAAIPLVVDLPASWVHAMLKQARQMGHQDHALGLVLFGAGLLPEEIIRLERSHHVCDKTHHILRIVAPPRQVPVNQWILGKHYGSYTNNPLTKWLKNRRDHEHALFINDTGAPMTLDDIQHHWDQWWQNMEIDVGTEPPKPIQARQTWCVEMLMRGMDLDNLSILTGCDIATLEPYAHRARENSAIAAATQLDRKISPS